MGAFFGGKNLPCVVTWPYSWQTDSLEAPYNHSALWIFGKYVDSQGQERMIKFDPDPAVHQTITLSGPSFFVQPASDSLGVFLRRETPGSGPAQNISLNLAMTDSLPYGKIIYLYGIEMVYVPGGEYWLGDSQQFHAFQAADSGSFKVKSEAMIPVGDSLGMLSTRDEHAPQRDIPALYPKGTDGFYLMKFEITQQQYADFLNWLPYEQQKAHIRPAPEEAVGTPALAFSSGQLQRNGLAIFSSANPPQKRAGIRLDGNQNGIFDEEDDGGNRACNFLTWQDVLAYLDWAGLRPITELEFEKAARGPAFVVPGEFAWGTAYIRDANTVLQDGTATETVSEQADSIRGLASHGYLGPDGPLRNGFGATDSSGRLQAGGSYFGLRELSGNLWELVVNVDSMGLFFTGNHGDGMLDSLGQANVAGWPLLDGAGHRGGALNSGIVGEFRDLAISDRFYIDLQPTQRRNTTGGRGGRSFPGLAVTQGREAPATYIFHGGPGSGYHAAASDPISSLELLLPDASWKLGPNPASDLVSLHWKGEGLAHLEVWSVDGKRMGKWELRPGRHSLQTKNWAPGLYMFRMAVGQRRGSRTLLVHP